MNPRAGTRMDLESVDEILELLRAAGIRVVVEGGWAVDALHGRQSRSHSDLDVAIAVSDFERCVATIEAEGFQQAVDELPVRAAFVDASGRQIDLHPRDLDSAWYAGVTVQRAISGVKIECLTPTRQLQQHRTYDAREVDTRDIALLQTLEGTVE